MSESLLRRGALLSGLFLVLSTLVAPRAPADVFLLVPGEDLIGAASSISARYEDTLLDIGRRHGLGYEDMRKANPTVNTWLPGEGTRVELPTRFVMPIAARQGIVVNLPEYRLYYFYRENGQDLVATFPISIGRMDWNTPIGRWSVIAKHERPTWFPPESIRAEHAADGRYLPRAVPPGPDNPLGDYSIRLSLPSYLIHGTNRPSGVGMRVTHGCIRMFPEDIEWLFPRVPVNAQVQIVSQPYKMGWSGDYLYLEVHPPLEEDEERRQRGLSAIIELYVRATADRAPDQVDWELIEQVFQEKRGLPVRVGSSQPRALTAGIQAN
ncbi:MAG: L,D-transpeptidase family protein [Chromatiales bacterium]|nr:L,D-transpeptidase family protein [Chromatiales bacterium]